MMMEQVRWVHEFIIKKKSDKTALSEIYIANKKELKKRRKKIAALIIYYTFARCYILLFCSFYCACEGVYERSSVCLMLFF